MAVSSAMKARPFSVAADARQFVKRFMSSEITDASCLFVCLFVCLLIGLFACLFVDWFVCLFVCLLGSIQRLWQ